MSGADQLRAAKAPKMFIVFSPEGMTAPVKTYPSHKSAAHDAWKMARMFPEQTFYVMQRQGRAARFADLADTDRAIALASSTPTERDDRG